MTTFELEINTDNAAFADDPRPELTRLLRQVATELRDGRTYGVIRDVNGTAVGTYRTKEES